MWRKTERSRHWFWRATLCGLWVSSALACANETSKLFERNSPEVDQAISELDAGRAEAATSTLTKYLRATGCDAGTLMVAEAADASNAGFDLSLTLFKIAELYGRRFGDVPPDRDGGASPEEKALAELRADQVDCAQAVLDRVLAGPLTPEHEARARYLRGNLSFLSGRWEDAIKDYDEALRVIPGIESDAGDSIGRDTAWNRALALRHKQDEDDKKDAGQDGDADADAPDSGEDSGDASRDSGDDSGDANGEDGGDDAGKNQGGDGGMDASPDGSKDLGNDAGDDQKPDAGDQQPSPPPSSTAQQPANQDDRMLDQFEQAPTWQREEAKARAAARKVRGMQDK